jgi:CAAX protease family protein
VGWARDHRLYRLRLEALPLALDSRRAILTLPIAYVVWFFAFQVPVLNFWIRITIAAFVLLVIALGVGRKELSLRPTPLAIVFGIASAVLLYLFFWSGYQVLKGFPQFAGTISSVYSLKGAEPVSFIASVLLFPIGPTEEIYWRGFIQNALAKRLSTRSSILLTSAVYGSIHVPTLNPSLIFVAFIGGLVWGYVYHRWGLAASMVSHVLWDEMIFVFFVIG